MIQKSGYITIEQAKYGVELAVPEDFNPDNVTFRDVTEQDLTNNKGRADGFVPYRLVTNLEIQNLDDFTVILRVYFTQRELGHLKKPKLAKWVNDQWKPFETINQYPLPGNPIWAGYLEVEFRNWGDPPVALGT